MAMTIIKNLNEEQTASVLETEGYVRIIAGPGSGKTKVLAQRYIHLTENLGVSTSNILCVTFTNKAANEMKRRIKHIVPDGDLSYISTFHGFCVTILREDINALSWARSFQILDNTDSKKLLKNVYEDCNFKLKDNSFKKVFRYIEQQKSLEPDYIEYLINPNGNILNDEYKKEKDNFKKIFLGYLYEQRKAQGLDFNDLMNFVLYIFNKDKSIKEKWQKRLQYIMVDEFQDVSSKQFYFVKLLSDYHKNLFVVGDPDQTIYSFRGANPDIILDFDKNFQGSKTFFLNKNYRSTPDIINVANSLISKNKNRIERTLEPVKNKKETVIYNHLKNDKLQGEWIAKQIKKLNKTGIPYNSIAILYRSHYVSRTIEEALIKNSIPYIIYSGTNFYERKEIKDAICYLKMLINKDDLSFLRTINEPKRNIGKKRIDFLKEYALMRGATLYQTLLENIENELFKKTGAKNYIQIIEKYTKLYKTTKPSDLLENILSESGYEEMIKSDGDEERLDNLAELKQSLFEYEQQTGEEFTLDDYLQKIALLTNSDKNDKKETVKLMTIHSSKGLEFPCVFVCALSEGIFPSKNITRKKELEEERRLAFVAFTRAENMLILTDAEGMNYNETYRYPSRFIFNIDKELLKYETELPKDMIQKTLNYIKINERELIDEDLCITKGDRIRHKFLGEGSIISYNAEKSEYTVKFDKLETERILNSSAPIEKI